MAQTNGDMDWMADSITVPPPVQNNNDVDWLKDSILANPPQLDIPVTNRTDISPNAPRVDIPGGKPKEDIGVVEDVARTTASNAYPAFAQVAAGLNPVTAPFAAVSYLTQFATKLGEDGANWLLGNSHEQAQNNSRELMNLIRRKIGVPELKPEDDPSLSAMVPTPQTLAKGAQDLILEGTNAPVKSYQPQTSAGQFVGSLIPMVSGMTGSGLTNSQKMIDALMALQAQGLARDAGGNDVVQDLAGIVGAGARTGVKAIAQTKPFQAPKTEETARLADIAQKYDIPLKQSDVADPLKLRGQWASGLNESWGSGKKAFQNEQQIAANRAVAAEMGETADAITPPVMERAASRMGKVYDDFANAHNVAPEQGIKLADTINKTRADWEKLNTDDQKSLNYQANKALQAINPDGSINGNKWGVVQRELGKDARRAGSREEYQFALYDLQQKVRDAMRNSLPPDAMAAFDKNNQQYRAMLAVEHGAKNVENYGNITPADLQTGVRKIYPNYAYNDQNSLPQLTQALQLLNRKAEAAPKISLNFGNMTKDAVLHGMGLLPNALGLGELLNSRLNDSALPKTGFLSHKTLNTPLQEILKNQAQPKAKPAKKDSK